MHNQSSRIASLDLLRGLAVMLVVAQHCAGTFKPSLPVLEDLAGHGNLGVQLFFIISGFTMMHTFGKIFTKKTILTFYIKRFCRIIPFFWLATIFYLSIDGLRQRYWAPNGIGTFEIFSTLTFTQWIWPTSINSVVPGGWSITIEMLFYLLFPLIILSFQKKINCYLLIAAIYIGGFFIKKYFLIDFFHNQLYENELHLIDWFFYFWLPKQSICFGFGILLYEIIEKNKINHLGLIALSICAIVSSNGRAITFLFLLSHLILTLRLQNNIISEFGSLSYSMYLVHFYIIEVFAGQPINIGGFELAYPFVLILTFIISRYITEPLIEKPSRSLGKKLSAKL